MTVFLESSGFPIAIASSPTRGSSFANVALGRSVPSTLTTARSVAESVARTCPPRVSQFDGTTWTAVALDHVVVRNDDAVRAVPDDAAALPATLARGHLDRDDRRLNLLDERGDQLVGRTQLTEALFVVAT